MTTEETGTPGIAARAAAAVRGWPTYARSLLMVVLIGLPALAVALLVRPSILDFVTGYSNEWLRFARHLDGPDSSELVMPDDLAAPAAERIAGQLADVRAMAHYHLLAAKTFFEWQYVTITISATAAVLAGVILVPISWSGWKDADPVLTTAFLIVAGIAALFTTYGQVYSQDANVAANTALYYGYLKIEDEILSFPARHAVADTTLAGAGALIRRWDARIAELRNFAVALDPESVPAITGIAEDLNAATATESPSN